MHHEADRNEVVVEVVEERAATSGIVERPAEAVLYEARPVLVGRDLPQLLDAEAELLRLPAAVEPVVGDQDLRQAATRAFGEQRVLGAQLHAAREVAARRAVLGNAHIA